MTKLLILSGKGGTGKTTIAAAFIKLLKSKSFADCDVDAPNLHLITDFPETYSESDFIGSQKAVINQEKCIGCGECKDICRFNAISNNNGHFTVNEFSCEGCAVCSKVCPSSAITLCDDVAGKLKNFSDNETCFSTAKLKMGRGNSGKLVTAVKNNLQEHDGIAVIDGSPGIGCPVIASISGVDYVLLVVEPSLSGISDMKRILDTSNHFNVQTLICVNKFNVSQQRTSEIENFCTDNDIKFVGKIPFDKSASKAINQGISLIDLNCPAEKAIKEVYKNVIKEIL